MSTSGYALIDSGEGQKLEQIGPVRFVRPCAHAVWRRQCPDLWSRADAHFTRGPGGDGSWTWRGGRRRDTWTVEIEGITFVIRTTDFGHLGIFPEQQSNWRRIKEVVRDMGRNGASPRVLNLFAYTGGSSLAAARAGAQVVHLDASKTSIRWARENAEASGLGDKPIRWIVDDVRKFIAREIRRQALYDAIILDPPTYGRGAKNEIWKIDTDISEFLDGLQPLLSPEFGFLLLTSHSPGFTPRVLENLVKQVVADRPGSYRSEEMECREREGGRDLPNGAACFFVSRPESPVSVESPESMSP